MKAVSKNGRVFSDRFAKTAIRIGLAKDADNGDAFESKKNSKLKEKKKRVSKPKVEKVKVNKPKK